jgi:hypothetical protein
MKGGKVGGGECALCMKNSKRWMPGMLASRRDNKKEFTDSLNYVS